MKKIYVFSIVFLFSVFFAQGQTMKRVMYEGFTSANCGYCVGTNAAIKPILAANPTRVVALKYHTNWPGGSDFANQNTQTWSGSRVSYYSVTGVPTTRVNGTGTTLSQDAINQQFTNTSPFFLEVNHEFINNNTQIEVEVKVRAAQDYTGNQMVLQLAMVERLITFENPPGSNGEREFNDVMRRMYPNASGTTLTNSWTNDQEQVFNFTVDVPTYIYNVDQIAFVAFIQTNTNKQVLQAAKSMKEIDAVVVNKNLNKDPFCDDSFAPEITIVNTGKNTISSATFNYGKVGTNGSEYEWSGELVSEETAIITLPSVEVSGIEPFFVKALKANDIEGEIFHITGVAAVYTDNSFVKLSYEEDFSSTSFPPEGCLISTTGNGPTWHRHSTNGGSARIELHRTTRNQEDNLYVEPIDLTEYGSFNLSFKVAHAMINSTNNGPSDRLMVQMSKDCGQTWTTVFSKSGANLATAPNNAQFVFVPTASQWREESFGISLFAGEPKVLVRFNVRSGVGNCLYIDDVKLEATSYLIHFGAEGENGTLTAKLNGSPIQSGTGVPPGSTVVFAATPEPNFLIDYWKVNGEVIEDNQDSEISISDINSLKEVKVAFRKDNTNIETIGQTSIKVFPVPARDYLSIVSEEMIQQLSIINMAGQEVYSANEVGLNHNVNVRNFESGIYVIRINTGRGVMIRKIQVE